MPDIDIKAILQKVISTVTKFDIKFQFSWVSYAMLTVRVEKNK